MKNIQAKQVRFNYVSFEDDSDFLQEKLTPEVEQLAEQSKKAQDSIEQLCTIFNLEKPNLRPQAPISAKTIKNTVKFVLDATVPGGELIQLLLGMKEMPTDAKGYAATAASIVMDMLPIGKVLKVVKGPAGKALMQQVEKQVLKQAEKRALKMVIKAGGKTEMKLLPQFTTRNIEDAVTYAMKDSKVEHLFAKASHNLGPLVTTLGGKEKAIQTIFNAANGKIPMSGIFEMPIVIQGYTVWIRGIVHNGIPKLGTMFIK